LAIRYHHLLKTFYAGFGWKDRQFPDGTIVWTAPTGYVEVRQLSDNLAETARSSAK
jgi:hypothetical protein